MKTKLLTALLLFTIFLINAQNLVAYYPFNGNSNDESGNGNHGTVNGATLTTDRLGNINSAYSFDGVNDYIQCLQPGPLGTEPRTVSFWAKTNGLIKARQSNAVLSYGASATSSNYGDRFEINLNNESNGLTITVGGAYLTKGFDNTDAEWHHYALVFDGGANKKMYDFKLYADGQLLITTTYEIDHGHTINTASTYPIHIGRLFDNTRYFNGTIDELKVYNKALTEEEIKNEYNEYRYLVAYYPFNGDADDESGNLLHGSVNGATITNDRFGNLESAYSFDGNDIITIPYDEKLNADSQLSISVWVKPNIQQDALILGKSNWWAQTNYLLRTKSTGFLQFEYRDMAYNNNIPLIVNEWNHIAVVSDVNSIKKIYINNVLATHTGGSSPFNMVQEVLTIGGSGSNGYNAEYFKGTIDDLRIYKTTLSESEISNLYNYNTLKVDKIEKSTTSNFYVFENTLYFKNTQNLSEIKSVEVYNLLGQNVFKTSEIKEEIQLNKLQNGVYILKVEKLNGNYSILKFLSKK